MRNWLNAFLLLLLFALVLVPVAGAATDSATCLGCHGSMEGAVNVNQEKFSKSVHGSFDCVMCHMTPKGAQHQGLSGGKPDNAVKALAEAISSKSKVDSIAQAACVQCHADVYDTYKASVHGKNVINKKSSDGPVCTSCHGSPHYIQPKSSKESAVNHFNVVKACGACHEEKFMHEKYGFSEHVMERYKESFHGRKLKVGHPGAPSCVSCHGAHDVRSAKDPASPVAGENKKKTCSKCHAGATDKFVAAITHKPLHPIAHFTELALIVLTLSVFVFICVHVLLDIFAEMRERLFRKKGGGHE
ncbi:MAG TPA: multiheme c-type cytochrome [Nitrospirota bacterium]